MDNEVVVRAGGARWLSSRAGGRCSCEALEPRTLMSSVAYADLGAMVPFPQVGQLGAEFISDRLHPYISVGDIDGDGHADVLHSTAAASELHSGATGALIRSHPLGARPYASLAALGDVDGDGVPDHTAPFIEADPFRYFVGVYSGASGSLLFSAEGTLAAAAGDADLDGRPDVLVVGPNYRGIRVLSGAGGGQLRFIDVDAGGVAGGADFNLDGTPDIAALSYALGDPAGHLVAYSGADGSVLFTVGTPGPGVGDASGLHLETGADLNGDGRPDLLVTAPEADGLHARVYSGADGGVVYEVPGAPISGPASLVGDLNGDGTVDLAVAAAESLAVGAPVGLYLRSGSTGEAIGFIRATGPAMQVDPAGPTSPAMTLSGPFAAGDVDGDGITDLVGQARLLVPGSVNPDFVTHLIIFNGATLGSPVIDGAGSTGTGSIEAWGHLGATGFIIHESRTVFLTDLGFRPGDRVLHFSSWDEGVMMVVQPAGDPGHPVAWYAMSDLTSPRVFSIADAQRTGQPPGTYAFDRVVDADDGRVLVQMMRDGATPTVWVFGLITGSSPAVSGQLVYKFDGRPVALRDERIVGAANDDPAATLLWTTLAGTPERIDGLTPIDLFLQKPDGQNPPPIVIVGLAQRGGDPGARLYYRDADGTFRALPLIEGGSDWAAAAVSSAGDVAGTFTRAGGGRSVFLTRYSYADDPTLRTIDLLAQTLIGAPGGLNGATAQVAGLATSRTGFGPFEVYIRYDDPDVGEGRSAALTEVDGSGPYRAPSGAAFALSDDGRALVTRNIAGEVLLYLRAADTGEWTKRDLAYSPGGIYGPPLYDVEHFGPITTWFEPGYGYPSIALATAGGLVLIEPYVTTMSGVPASMLFERYRVRNLTQELAGSQAITQSLLTILPNTTRLRLVAGLNADGDLVMYGQTGIVTHDIGTVSAWAFANLYDQVLRPTGLPEPRFDVANYGDLVGYVTAWGGLNFAGIDADSGDLTVFWTAPGLSGWQVADLDQSLADPSIATGVSHLSVYLTSWGGINLVGGSKLGVYWWAPGMGATWAFNELTGIAAGALLRPETVTAYTTPWNGLNVAGLDQAGKLWVYWWTPTVYWTAETIDAALPARDAAVERAGRLRSAVSGQGEISIFARSAIGNPLLYRWSPTADWALTDLLAAAPSYL